MPLGGFLSGFNNNVMGGMYNQPNATGYIPGAAQLPDPSVYHIPEYHSPTPQYPAPPLPGGTPVPLPGTTPSTPATGHNPNFGNGQLLAKLGQRGGLMGSLFKFFAQRRASQNA